MLTLGFLKTPSGTIEISIGDHGLYRALTRMSEKTLMGALEDAFEKYAEDILLELGKTSKTEKNYERIFSASVTPKQPIFFKTEEINIVASYRLEQRTLLFGEKKASLTGEIHVHSCWLHSQRCHVNEFSEGMSGIVIGPDGCDEAVCCQGKVVIL